MRHNHLLFLLLILCSCQSGDQSTENGQKEYKFFTGPTQGTSYNITCVGDSIPELKPAIDSLLATIDSSLSLWLAHSTINRFNDSSDITVKDPYFMEMFFRSKEISSISDGAFNPMVMPLVSAWGFGPDGGEIKDNVNIDSLKALVSWDFDVIELNSTKAYRFIKRPGSQIDFNAIAQGYTVDVVADFIENKNIHNYMVEIGGELRAKGTNAKGHIWRIAIDKPTENAEERTLQDILLVENAALATSGSYRKFYEKDGNKYSHTIDPKTGKPVTHSLLSVTVMADKAATSDAFATAFMVMGTEKTIQFLNENPKLKLEVYLIYADEKVETKTFISEGMRKSLAD